MRTSITKENAMTSKTRTTLAVRSGLKGGKIGANHSRRAL